MTLLYYYFYYYYEHKPCQSIQKKQKIMPFCDEVFQSCDGPNHIINSKCHNGICDNDIVKKKNYNKTFFIVKRLKGFFVIFNFLSLLMTTCSDLHRQRRSGSIILSKLLVITYYPVCRFLRFNNKKSPIFYIKLHQSHTPQYFILAFLFNQNNLFHY